LLDRLIDFFNCLPRLVGGEASLVIAALSGHEFIDLSGDFDLEYVARGLFEAPTRLERLGNLINVVAMLDAYFAGDPRVRLGPLLVPYNRLCLSQGNQRLAAARDRCPGRLAAIERPLADWTELRRTALTTAAPSAALCPTMMRKSDGDVVKTSWKATHETTKKEPLFRINNLCDSHAISR
jgi:hypothetical protein